MSDTITDDVATESAKSTTYDVDVDYYWRNGYTIVPSVYTPEEVQALREDARATLGKAGDLLHHPRLRKVLTDGRLISIAKQILGNDNIWYGGDSSFTWNSKQHGYHKDNADRDDPNAPDWTSGRYTLLRFGVYLQDHYTHTGGLNLRVGSHNIVDLTSGKNIYIRSKPGDVAVWSLRTSHSGNGTLLSFPRWVYPDPDLKAADYPKWWKVAEPDGDRIAVFAALGLDDAHADRYSEYLKTREYMCNIWRNGGQYDEAALEEARAAGLTVRDMPSEVIGNPDAGREKGYKPIPY